MNYNFSEEDIKFVEKAIELKNKGYYIDSTQLTEHYNRILDKRVNNTSCGSCIRQRITELEAALNTFKQAQETLKKVEPVVTKAEEENPVKKENKKVKK